MATLGSCNRGVSARALRYLLGCPRLLVAYDVDAEGEKGAERLEQLSPRVQRIRPPVGKDVTDFWRAGGRVRDWVRFELARLCQVDPKRHDVDPWAALWRGGACPHPGWSSVTVHPD